MFQRIVAKNEDVQADAYFRALGKRFGHGDANAVEKGSVAAVKVFQPECLSLLHNPAVTAGNGGKIKNDVAVRVTPDGEQGFEANDLRGRVACG